MQGKSKYFAVAAVILLVVVGISAFESLSTQPNSASNTTTSDRSSITTTTSYLTIQTTSTLSTTVTVSQNTTITLTLSSKTNTSIPNTSMLTAQNLRIELLLSSSNVPSGTSVTITMNLSNIATTENPVPTSWSWPNIWLSWPGLLGCGENSYGYPLGIAIFKGYYTPHNASETKPLNLTANSIVYGCPNWPPVQDLVFRPFSNVVDGAPPRTISYSLSVNGTWTGNGTVFTHFTPGIYTVVLGDEWGDLLFLYFRSS